MLKQRIVTALVLVAILAIVLTVAAPYGFPPFALLMVGIVIGEWLALLAFPRTTCVAVAVVAMIVLWSVHASRIADVVALIGWSAAAIVWIALALGLFVRGRFPDVARWRLAHAILAVFLPAACWFALVDAYLVGRVGGGLAYLVSILAIVWAADIAAYFAGRAFGRRKLAPTISPGKTWAGAIGGVVAAVLFAFVTTTVPAFADTYFAVLARTWPRAFSIPIVLVVAIVLVVLSIVGDLFESHLKRQRGVKDSGRLLPGHGGVFDRVDALLPIVPVALLLQRLA